MTAPLDPRPPRSHRGFETDSKADSGPDITIGGPELAGQALAAGLVDECQLFLTPIVVGRGKPAPPDDVRTPLELLGERRFASGVVYLRYGVGARD